MPRRSKEQEETLLEGMLEDLVKLSGQSFAGIMASEFEPAHVTKAEREELVAELLLDLAGVSEEPLELIMASQFEEPEEPEPVEDFGADFRVGDIGELEDTIEDDLSMSNPYSNDTDDYVDELFEDMDVSQDDYDTDGEGGTDG